MEYNLINHYFAPSQKMHAQYLSAQLEYKVENIFNILKTAAEDFRMQNTSDLCKLEQRLKIEQITVSLKDGISHIALINNKGIVVCATVGEIEGVNISSLSHIQEQQASKKPIISRLIVNPLGEKSISFTIPVFSESGEYLGILEAALKQDYLKQFLSSDSSFSPGGYNTLSDDNDAILYHPNESFIGESFFGEKMQEAIDQDQELNNMYKKMMLGKTGYDFYVFDGIDKVAGYAPVHLQNSYRFWAIASTANLKDYSIFIESFFIKGLIVNLILIAGVFILILLAMYFFNILRERVKEVQK